MGAEPLRVAVVGGGIAGLTVAAALGRAGLHCEVFEQARQVREVGAGLQLSPNATGPLRRLGLGDHLDQVAVRPAAIEMRGYADGRARGRTPLGAEAEQRYGAPYLTVHRADLYQGLLGRLGPETLRLGRRCVALDEEPDGVTVRFADGGAYAADVVIGADGIHSVVRGMLIGDRPRFSGQLVYRGLAPADRLAHLVREHKVLIWLGPGRHLVCYPISGGKMVSFVATTPAGDWREESWTAPGRVEDLVASYTEWHDDVWQVLTAADTVTRWALHDRDPVGAWSRDRITLAGDAAHPMLPFGAQGANQAIEDAVVLAACLAGRTPAEVPAALRRYQGLRMPRTARVQQAMRANAKHHHESDEAARRERDRRMTEDLSLSTMDWLYGYDAEASAG